MIENIDSNFHQLVFNAFINITFIVLLCKLLNFHFFFGHKFEFPFFNFVYFAVNSDECLMTRMQEMSLDYHFTVEQEVGSSTYAFFGFNGTLRLHTFFSYHYE